VTKKWPDANERKIVLDLPRIIKRGVGNAISFFYFYVCFKN